MLRKARIIENLTFCKSHQLSDVLLV